MKKSRKILRQIRALQKFKEGSLKNAKNKEEKCDEKPNVPFMFVIHTLNYYMSAQNHDSEDKFFKRVILSG